MDADGNLVAAPEDEDEEEEAVENEAGSEREHVFRGEEGHHLCNSCCDVIGVDDMRRPVQWSREAGTDHTASSFR